MAKIHTKPQAQTASVGGVADDPQNSFSSLLSSLSLPDSQVTDPSAPLAKDAPDLPADAASSQTLALISPASANPMGNLPSIKPRMASAAIGAADASATPDAISTLASKPMPSSAPIATVSNTTLGPQTVGQLGAPNNLLMNGGLTQETAAAQVIPDALALGDDLPVLAANPAQLRAGPLNTLTDSALAGSGALGWAGESSRDFLQNATALAAEAARSQADSHGALRKAGARRDTLSGLQDTIANQLVTGGGQDTRDLKALQFTQNLGAMAVVSEKLVSNELQKTEGQLGGQSSNPSRAKLSNLFETSPQFGGPTNSPSLITAPGNAEAAQPLEMQVAQQVNYWVSRHVQNAEMTLSGFEGMSVDVSITMQGNQAQVDFRTDQLDIRAVLQGSESHLKDSMAKEGLVLAGLSVGVSSSGGQQTPQDKGERAARQFKLPTQDLKLGALTQMPGIATRNSIDVFV